MVIIKKLDKFILGNFLQLFAGTFCISLFVVMMQFLWKYIDDLVGKGLDWDVYLKFFFYAAETLVPMALPLAILLASLISFGNIGEKLELLAIKAAGISLFRTLAPLIILVSLLSLASFHFQNKIAPEAQQKLMQMLYSMRLKSPETEIAERTFQTIIPDRDVNIYVNKKDMKTGMLYDVILYNMEDGVNKAHIILADSARLESSSDKQHILLHLYEGEQFENLNDNALEARNVPYRRETFVEKHFIFDFDANFNLADQESVSGNAMTKNMKQLVADIDSMERICDSLSNVYVADMRRSVLRVSGTADPVPVDSSAIKKMSKSELAAYNKEAEKKQAAEDKRKSEVPVASINIDTIYSQLNPNKQQSVMMAAIQKVGYESMDVEYKAGYMEETDKDIRRHEIQYWQKITMSLACLMFFFIGAPLGAIIRKGGLGMPVVVSVIIFLLYYIINTGGMKTGREGSIPVWLGMWLSTIILAPLGIFFTVKANSDSAVFNMDPYRNFFRKFWGIRTKRHITRKEVIIDDPNYPLVADYIGETTQLCHEYLKNNRKRNLWGYLKFIFSKRNDKKVEEINDRLESTVEVLSNSKDREILMLLNYLPVMETRNFRFYRRKKRDLKAIIKYGNQIKEHINGKY